MPVVVCSPVWYVLSKTCLPNHLVLFSRPLTLPANLRRNLYRGGIADETLAVGPKNPVVQIL